MKNLTWQNPEQLFVAQVLINKVKSKCCGIKVMYKIQNIKEGIYDLVYITFLHGSPSYQENVIRNGINLFIDFLNTKSENENLHGLSIAITAKNIIHYSVNDAFRRKS